jgi:hypothetical protein
MEIYLWCFLKIFILHFIEVIFKESCLELEKSDFEVKQTCTF